MQATTSATLANQISKLKQEKNAIILAHYYQSGDIQDVADFVGDSLELSRKAAATDADIILFAGVHFMAETAKILSPNKRVLLPDLAASCSLAESCTVSELREWKSQYPDHVTVAYINTPADVKAECDLICTSVNAVKVIQSIPEGQPILFLPDANLGDYLIKQTGREMKLWEGACQVHEAFAIDKILDLKKAFPTAEFIAHPESEKHILKVASFIGSTSALIKYVKESNNDTFIVATEAGVLHEMQKVAPNKQIIPAPAEEENHCACSECEYMKVNTLQKVYDCLKNESPEIQLTSDIRLAAFAPLKKMLAI
tara:strand:- start:291 stop:1229 length:939 start_codon:yes stop_codon:yes gene_type:complete